MLNVVQKAELDLSWPLKSLTPTTEYLMCMLDSNVICMQQAQLLWSSVWYIGLASAGTVSPDISLTLIILCTMYHSAPHMYCIE